jgi:hypothetical protein
MYKTSMTIKLVAAAVVLNLVREYCLLCAVVCTSGFCCVSQKNYNDLTMIYVYTSPCLSIYNELIAVALSALLSLL